MSKLADLIWKNAELLRGAYKENEYRKVILGSFAGEGEILR